MGELCLLLSLWTLTHWAVNHHGSGVQWKAPTRLPANIRKHAVTGFFFFLSLSFFSFILFSRFLFSLSLLSGKCYKQVVLTPMLEKRSHESVLATLPHTVALISMPSAANGQRGLSVAVLRDGSGSASVQVKEWVEPHPFSWLPFMLLAIVELHAIISPAWEKCVLLQQQCSAKLG